MSEQLERPARRSDAHFRRTPLQFAIVVLSCLLITGSIVVLAILSSGRP